MQCPVCDEPMIILEYEEVELDYCVSCHGVWLDADELALLFGDREMTEGFMTAGHPRPAPGEKTRRCPECGAKMRKEATGGPAPVTYDHCPNEDGLWFDNGELGLVLRHGSDTEGTGALRRWLGEMFPEREQASADIKDEAKE